MDNEQSAQAPHTESSSPTPQVTVDNTTLMGILAYLGPLVIIPFLTAKDQPFVKFHIKQGLILFVIEILLYIIGGVIMSIFFWQIINLLNLGIIILSIVGIVNVVQKKEVELPLVGQFAQKFNI